MKLWPYLAYKIARRARGQIKLRLRPSAGRYLTIYDSLLATQAE